MFETGGIYGYGPQQFAPQGMVPPGYSQGYTQGYAGSLPGFGQPGGVPIGTPYGQQQVGAQPFGGQQQLGGQAFGGQPFGVQPFGGQAFGGQQFGGQQFGGQQIGGQQLGGQQLGGQLGGLGGGMAQRYLPLIPQSPFPLTFAPGTAPFAGQQPQQIPGPLGGMQFGPPQPQLFVVPVLTPQGWVGQLIVAGGQAPGGGVGAGFGIPQFAPTAGVQPSVPWAGMGYGYGTPQMTQPGIMGGAQQQVPQVYVPIPVGTIPFPGQPLAAAPIH